MKNAIGLLPLLTFETNYSSYAHKKIAQKTIMKNKLKTYIWQAAG